MGDSSGDGRSTLSDLFELMRDPHLGPEAKVVWALYRSYEGPNGKGAYPGDELLAEHLDRSPRTVQRYRAQLVEGGFLEKEFRGPKPARYRAVVPEQKTGDTSDGDWGSEDPPGDDAFPSAFFVEGVQQLLWLADEPPPGAPDGWSIQADLRDLRQAWTGLGTERLTRCLHGLRLLADADQLPAVAPEEGFTLGLLKTLRGNGLWRAAERAYRREHDDPAVETEDGMSPLEAVAGELLADMEEESVDG